MAPTHAADLGQRAGPDPGQDRGDQDDHREQVEQIHAAEYRRGGEPRRQPVVRGAPRRQSMVTVTGGASPNAVTVYVPGSSSPRSTIVALVHARSRCTRCRARAALPSRTVSVNVLPSRATSTPARTLHGSTPLYQATRTARSRPFDAVSSLVAATGWMPVSPTPGATSVGWGSPGIGEPGVADRSRRRTGVAAAAAAGRPDRPDRRGRAGATAPPDGPGRGVPTGPPGTGVGAAARQPGSGAVPPGLAPARPRQRRR